MPLVITAFIGFIAGPLAFVALARWIGLVLLAPNQIRTASGKSNGRRAVVLAICQSIFHAGPWSVATFVFVAYQVRSTPWAPWFFVGFALSFGLMCIASVQILLRLRAAAAQLGR